LLERDLVAERFARVARWINADPQRLVRLRKRATALKVRDILPAAIQLKIFQGLSTDEALNVLPVSVNVANGGGNCDQIGRYRSILVDIGKC